jgi:hypothetical protein
MSPTAVKARPTNVTQRPNKSFKCGFMTPWSIMKEATSVMEMSKETLSLLAEKDSAALQSHRWLCTLEVKTLC